MSIRLFLLLRKIHTHTYTNGELRERPLVSNHLEIVWTGQPRPLASDFEHDEQWHRIGPLPAYEYLASKPEVAALERSKQQLRPQECKQRTVGLYGRNRILF